MPSREPGVSKKRGGPSRLMEGSEAVQKIQAVFMASEAYLFTDARDFLQSDAVFRQYTLDQLRTHFNRIRREYKESGDTWTFYLFSLA